MHTGTLIFMRNVPGKPKHRALTRPLPFEKYGGGEGLIPAGYEWDGSSVPFIFSGDIPAPSPPYRLLPPRLAMRTRTDTGGAPMGRRTV